MPLSLTKLVGNHASVTIDFGDGDTLRVDYYPRRVTSRMLLDIAATQTLTDATPEQALRVMDRATDILLTLLASWDLVDGPDDQPVPIDREHLADLGMTVQWTILSAIMASSAGNGSGGGGGAGEAAAPGAAPSAPTSGAIS